MVHNMVNKMIDRKIHKSVPLAASLAAAVFFAAAAMAQTTASPAENGNTAKPSPYQGVSHPPADDTITTSDEPPAQSAPATQANSAPSAAAPSHAAVALTPPSPELAPDDRQDDDDEPASPVLKSRPDLAPNHQSNNADDAIVTYVPGPANALPEGTVFRVRMLQDVSAETALPGTPFRAKLIENLMRDGHVVVPAGSELRGRITRASTGRRITGSSVIHLRPEEFILPDGTRYRLEARVIDTQGSNTKASGEGNIVPKSGAQRTLTDLAATSGGGAIVGASIAGPVGAAVGSAVGAGVVTGDWLFQDRAADLPQDSTVIFSLTDPMFLTRTHN